MQQKTAIIKIIRPMAHFQIRRSLLSNNSKLKKHSRVSESALLGTISNRKNYLNAFNQSSQSASDKQNQNQNQILPGKQTGPLCNSNNFMPNGMLKKRDSDVYFHRKSQNGFSLEKHSRTPLGDRHGLKNRENGSGGLYDYEQIKHMERSSSTMSVSMIVKTEKKGPSLNKRQNNSCTIQNSTAFKFELQSSIHALKEKKIAPYFIDALVKKSKAMTQALLNIHLSIITFKTFKRACMFVKPRHPDPKIPPQTPGRKTIIFDMDETLIHTNEMITAGYQIKVPFRTMNGRVLFGYTCVRPYAKELLKRLSEHFDIIVFTAGSQPYADPILDHIDPQRVIQHRLYRESCTLVDSQVFVKDLRIIGRPLDSLVLVDNAPHTYMLQLANGIPILPYYKGKQDRQLYTLETYLMGLKDVQDMRRVNTETFKLEQYSRFDSREKAVAELYGKYL